MCCSTSFAAHPAGCQYQSGRLLGGDRTSALAFGGDERSLAGIGGPRTNVDQTTLGGSATAAAATSGADSLGISAGPDVAAGCGRRRRADHFRIRLSFRPVHWGAPSWRIDFGDRAAPGGATRPGKVTFAAPGLREPVVIDHGEGITSSYNHLQQITV